MRVLPIPRTLLVALLLTVSSSFAWSQSVVEPQEPAPNPAANAIAAAKASPADATPNPGKDRGKLRIGPGDLLDISIYGVSDFHQEARVTESGDISLPLIGSVHMGGASVQEAQDVIAKALVLGGYYRDPHVMVLIKEFSSERVSILGEVTKPGLYPIVGTRTLLDLISEAGGFSQKAGNQVTITHRDQPNQPTTVTLSNEPGKPLVGNVEIDSGDTIVVSKAGIVYVVGDVGRPGGFIMENNQPMTVLQAIAMAAGTNRTAALNSARIIRRTPTGPTQVKIPLKQIMAAKANDMPMYAEDILFIPGSAAKNAMSRGLESIFQVATSAAIYGATF